MFSPRAVPSCQLSCIYRLTDSDSRLNKMPPWNVRILTDDFITRNYTWHGQAIYERIAFPAGWGFQHQFMMPLSHRWRRRQGRYICPVYIWPERWTVERLVPKLSRLSRWCFSHWISRPYRESWYLSFGAPMPNTGFIPAYYLRLIGPAVILGKPWISNLSSGLKLTVVSMAAVLAPAIPCGCFFCGVAGGCLWLGFRN